MNKTLFLIGICLIVVTGSACGTAPQNAGVLSQNPAESLTAEQPTAINPLLTATPTDIPTATPLPSATPIVVLPPEPVEVKFQAADGANLSGMYFPAEENPAPIIVLMHWARGDQSEWEDIATWLQGRGQLVREPDYNDSWKSSDWYPERELDWPLGVFTFTFRNCVGGCQAYLPAEWLLDAQAAVETATRLQGADPEMIITVGASIGADGAVDSCTWLNQTSFGSCLGSFALSPASLLTTPFGDAAVQLLSNEPPLPVYCLYGLRDDASVETCQEIPEVETVDYGYIENHGLELIQPNQKPDPLKLLQEFILAAVGEVE